MQCKRCLETDSKYFYQGSKGYYCRRCISFGRVLLGDKTIEEDLYIGVDVEYKLGFNLTSYQEECSKEVVRLVKESDVLVYAACGAGKTEIVMESIKVALREGKRVGIAIPRRQVVLQLTLRLQEAFKELKVVAVCQGYTEDVRGDIVVCTTHQLYRYYQYFDLLIMDEPDAFPYYGNKVLAGIATTSCKGHKIYLSATPDEELLKLPTVSLFKRPHGYPIPEPIIMVMPYVIQLLYLLYWLKTHPHALIFVPTIKRAKQLGKWLRLPVIHSKTSNKEEIINAFQTKKTPHLICTSILERGVTFGGIDIIVLEADHMVFSNASLIQISGRVGRSMQNPKGDGVFLCRKKSRKVATALSDIQKMNA